jgi:hypothetical protein
MRVGGISDDRIPRRRIRRSVGADGALSPVDPGFFAP